MINVEGPQNDINTGNIRTFIRDLVFQQTHMIKDDETTKKTFSGMGSVRDEVVQHEGMDDTIENMLHLTG